VTAGNATVALERVLHVLRPLVRLLLRSGINYPALAAALKRVFLDEARAELQRRGMVTTDSALTLLSGVHRKDVRALTRGERAVQQPARPVLGLAAEVVGRWMQDARYLDARKRPRALARGGEDDEQSFDALVAGVSRDVRARALLGELVRLGVAEELDDGRVRLLAAGFAPRLGFEEMAGLMAANLHDHAAAAVDNLAGEANFLEQAVFVDELSEASVETLRADARAAWQVAMRAVMARARECFDADQALPAHERRRRARFGVYFYNVAEGEGS
jgi:hypothetical protein